MAGTVDLPPLILSAPKSYQGNIALTSISLNFGIQKHLSTYLGIQQQFFSPVLHNGSAYMMGGDMMGISDLLGILFSNIKPESQEAVIGLAALAVISTKGKAVPGIMKAEAEIAGADAYAGVKAASKFLQEAGVSRANRITALQSFQIETISLKTADNSTFGLRFFDNVNAFPRGRYLFPSFSDLTNRVGLALPPKWNGMTNFTQWQIEPGTTYIYGRAASQGGIYTGGSFQMYISDVSSLIK